MGNIVPLSLLRQHPNARTAAVYSASSEAGLCVQPPQADDGNDGALILRASGVPLASGSYDLALVNGGNATGYTTWSATTGGIIGVPGATLRYRTTGGTWQGYSDTPYVSYARPVLVGTAGTDYPGFSPIRELPSGGAGFVYCERGSPNRIRFAYKTTRAGAWTSVTIHSATLDGAIIDDQEPALIVTPTGRLIAFYALDVGGSQLVIRAATSTDSGATWAVWSSAVYQGISSNARRLTAEYVEDSILLTAGMKAGSATVAASILWSSDGGQRFTLAAEPTLGPISTCVTRVGTVLLLATDQTNNGAVVYTLLPGSGLSAAGSGAASSDNVNSVHALARRDDGTLWSIYGTNDYPAYMLKTEFSRDHGATWEEPSMQSSEGIHNTGESAIAAGFRVLSLGWWGATGILLCGTDGTTATVDDSIYEMNLGGWDSITDEYYAGERSDPYGHSSFAPVDHPHNLGWTRTDAGGGATVSFTADGYNIVSTGAASSYWTASATWQSTASTIGRRIRAVFKVNSGGSISDNRAIIRYDVADGSGNRKRLIVRFGSTQIRIVDEAGTTLGTGSELVSTFGSLTELLIAFDTSTTSTTGTVSAWYRLGSQSAWTNFVNAATVSEAVGAASTCVIGGSGTGAADWTLAYLGVADGDGGILPDGFTNPDELAGRPLDAATDFALTNGIHIGAAGGAGVEGDSYTLETTASFAADWIWRSNEPWQAWRSAADNTDANVVFRSTGDVWTLDTVALFGTNFRTATWQMHASDSWGSPSMSATLDATLAAVTIGTAGAGYIKASNGLPWRSGQWRSRVGRKFYVAAGGSTYEITDNTRDTLLVRGVDLTAATGTAYIFGDRMALRLGRSATFAFGRLLVSSQDTAEGYYQVGALYIGERLDTETPYASGFVAEVGDPAVLTVSDEGRRLGYERGPTPERWRIAYDPASKPEETVVDDLEDLWRSIPGSRHPVVVWPDHNAPQDFFLGRILGPFGRENVYGQGATALERLAQLVIERVA